MRWSQLKNCFACFLNVFAFFFFLVLSNYSPFDEGNGWTKTIIVVFPLYLQGARGTLSKPPRSSVSSLHNVSNASVTTWLWSVDELPRTRNRQPSTPRSSPKDRRRSVMPPSNASDLLLPVTLIGNHTGNLLNKFDQTNHNFPYFTYSCIVNSTSTWLIQQSWIRLNTNFIASFSWAAVSQLIVVCKRINKDHLLARKDHIICVVYFCVLNSW